MTKELSVGHQLLASSKEIARLQSQHIQDLDTMATMVQEKEKLQEGWDKEAIASNEYARKIDKHKSCHILRDKAILELEALKKENEENKTYAHDKLFKKIHEIVELRKELKKLQSEVDKHKSCHILRDRAILELEAVKKELAEEIKEHEAEQKDCERDFDALRAELAVKTKALKKIANSKAYAEVLRAIAKSALSK